MREGMSRGSKESSKKQDLGLLSRCTFFVCVYVYMYMCGEVCSLSVYMLLLLKKQRVYAGLETYCFFPHVCMYVYVYIIFPLDPKRMLGMSTLCTCMCFIYFK